MLWVMLFVLVVTIYFLAAKWNNIYGIVFGLEMLAIELLLFTLLQCSFSFSGYYFGTQMEYFLYKCIRWMNVSFFRLNIVVNMSICLFLFANTVLYMKSILNKSKKCLVGHLFVWILLSIFVFIFNSHTVTERIYLLSFDNDDNKHYLLSRIGSSLCIIILLLYSLVPVITLLYRIYKTQMQCRKKVYLSLLGLDLILICLFNVVLQMPPIKYFFCNSNFIDFSPFDNLGNYESYYWFICIGMLLIIFIIEVSKKYNLFGNAKIAKKVFIDMTDVRYVFHTYKNVFFSIAAISAIALKKETIDDIRPLLLQIQECADSYVKHVGNFLDIENIKKRKDGLVDIVGCIEKSEKTVFFPEYIKIQKRIKLENRCIKGDEDRLTECIRNLLDNAIDAIRNKECEEGLITIVAWNEEDAVCISIEDNGQGISKRNLNKIFHPFFSTKKTKANWGMGLAYVKSCIEMHGGTIDVLSRENVFTVFQMWLPIGENAYEK